MCQCVCVLKSYSIIQHFFKRYKCERKEKNKVDKNLIKEPLGDIAKRLKVNIYYQTW